MPQLNPGTTIGLYRVEELIACGGFGAVYRVSRDGRNFALKLPLQGFPRSGPEANSSRYIPRAAEGGGRSQHVLSRVEGRGATSQDLDEDRRTLEQRIIREVVSLMTLSHPNIVRVHSFDRWPSPVTGALYLVMDFVEGVPLLQWRRNERPTLREVVELFRMLALALDEMHRLGVVHRDIKSSNVLVAPQTDIEGATGWTPVLVDFGLARPAFTTNVTREYVLVGTEGLWAPEHVGLGGAACAEGARFQYTPATDLHTLGLLFYEALTGQRALLSDSRDFAAALREVPRLASTVSRAIPEQLDGPLARLLAKTPEERTASGAELAAELDALLSGADERWDQALPTPTPGLQPAPSSPTSPQRRLAASASASSATSGPVPGPATVSPQVVVSRTADATPPPAPEKPAAATVQRPAARPKQPRRGGRLRLLALSSAGIVATLVGLRAGLWAGGLSFTPSPIEPVKGSPTTSEPPLPAGPVVNRGDARPASPVMPATGAQAKSQRQQPKRTATPVQAVQRRAISPLPVVRATTSRPVRVGPIEALLVEPLVANGLIVLPAGAALMGVAAELEGGGLTLRFDAARLRNGTRSAVDGAARLDAGAAQRRPLQRDVVPSPLEFDVSLTASR